jgi:hypothetical protein
MSRSGWNRGARVFSVLTAGCHVPRPLGMDMLCALSADVSLGLFAPRITSGARRYSDSHARALSGVAHGTRPIAGSATHAVAVISR